MRFVVAPAGFKECLDADAVATAIRSGIQCVVPSAITDLLPVIDGGEGSARLFAGTCGGELIHTDVTGPVGQPVRAHFALLRRRRTAFVEMAAAAGLSLVPPEQRDPGTTTSRGVGQLITAALDTGAVRIIIGCGDSGVCDGGAGALRALGARVLDTSGHEIGEGGAELTSARRVDAGGLDSRLADTDIIVATNPANVLCGPNGVARTYGPQKGATPRRVEELAMAAETWAEVLRHHSGTDFRHVAGSGASGGLGAGLAGILGARLTSRFDTLLDHAELDRRLAEADIVITAEGAIDASTPRGKVPAEIARRAKAHGKPVIALAGTIGTGAESSYGSGIDAFAAIVPGPVELADAIARAPRLIADATARTLRLLLVGQSLRAQVPEAVRG